MTQISNSPDPAGFFVFNEKTIRHILAYNTILWVQAVGYYSAIYLKEKDSVICSKNLGDLEDEFVQAGFCRVHRSHLVNVNEVVTFEDRKIILTDDTVLPVSYREISNFIRTFYKIKKQRLRRPRIHRSAS